MKKLILPALTLLLLGTATARAQSSVTLYGVLDEALQFVHNANPHNDNLWALTGSNLHSNHWGRRCHVGGGGGA